MFSGPSCREKEVCLKHCNILEVSLPAEFYNIEYRVYYYNSNYIFLPTTSKWLLPRKIIGQLECRPKENNKRLRRDGLLLKQDSENEIAQKCGEKQRPQIK